MLTRLYLLGWYWWGELGSTLEKLLSAAMVSIFTHPSLLSLSVLDGCIGGGRAQTTRMQKMSEKAKNKLRLIEVS